MLAVIGILGLALLLFMINNSFHGRPGSGISTITQREGDTSANEFFATYQINDSLSASENERLRNLFQQKKQNRDIINEGHMLTGWSFGDIGFYKANDALYMDDLTTAAAQMVHLLDSVDLLFEKDSAKREQARIAVKNLYLIKQDQESKKPADMKYYFALKNYRYSDMDTRFFIKDGQYKMLLVEWDNVPNKLDAGETKKGHYIVKPVKLRYKEKENTALIPMAKGAYDIISTICKAFTFLFAALCLYVFIGFPIMVLFNISKGRAFTEANIIYLKNLSRVSIVITSLGLLSPLLLSFIFKSVIPAELKGPTLSDIFADNFRMIVFTIFIFIINKAFRKGYRLQQEQDLTI